MVLDLSSKDHSVLELLALSFGNPFQQLQPPDLSKHPRPLYGDRSRSGRGWKYQQGGGPTGGVDGRLEHRPLQSLEAWRSDVTHAARRAQQAELDQMR